MFAPLVAVALSLAAVPVQPALPAQITVTGESEVKFAPNQVTVQFTVAADGKDQSAAKKGSEEKVRGVVAALKGAGVDARRVVVSDVGLNPNYRSNEVVGWVATRSLVVEITDMKRLEEPIAAAIKAGATPATTVRLHHTEQRKYEDEARIAAARSARSRALATIEALGAKLGPPRIVNEASVVLQGSTATLNTLNGVVIGTADPQLSVSSRVTVQFDIDG